MAAPPVTSPCSSARTTTRSPCSASCNGDAFTPPDAAALLDELARAGAPDPGQVLAGYRERVQAQGGSPDDLAAIRSAFLTDAIYRRPAIEMALAQAAAGGRSFAFLFSATPFGPALGAFHAADQMYIFDNYLEAVGAAAPGDFLPVRDALIASVRAEFPVLHTLDGVIDPIAGALWRARTSSHS